MNPLPVHIVRDALLASDFELLCVKENCEHWVREGRHVVVHIDGANAAHVENVQITQRANRITFTFDGMPAEMFHVKEEQ